MSETASLQAPLAGQEAALVAALGERSIVLVGMMGVGKSTIGRRLAARLGLSFADADHEIEIAHAGMTVREIFAEHGEPYFREGEARVIARLLDGAPCVLATGGGSFLREDTRHRIQARAVSIWLRADADVILRRVKRRADRPLLMTDDPAATIQHLIEQRYPIYQQADLTVVSRDEPHEKIVAECIDVLHSYLCNAGTSGVSDAQ